VRTSSVRASTSLAGDLWSMSVGQRRRACLGTAWNSRDPRGQSSAVTGAPSLEVGRLGGGAMGDYHPVAVGERRPSRLQAGVWSGPGSSSPPFEDLPVQLAVSSRLLGRAGQIWSLRRPTRRRRSARWRRRLRCGRAPLRGDHAAARIPAGVGTIGGLLGQSMPDSRSHDGHRRAPQLFVAVRSILPRGAPATRPPPVNGRFPPESAVRLRRGRDDGSGPQHALAKPRPQGRPSAGRCGTGQHSCAACTAGASPNVKVEIGKYSC
jgi:hypothetical protein